jgi:hypothetical protein
VTDDQPPRHELKPTNPPQPLSRKQILMYGLRAARTGGAVFPTDWMYELADIFTEEIQQLEGQLAQAESALRHERARAAMYRGIAEGEEQLARQIEKATPPKHASEGEQ